MCENIKYDRSVSTRVMVAFAVAALFLGVIGCQTPQDRDSQMPWSTPQDWESSPMLPGMGPRY